MQNVNLETMNPFIVGNQPRNTGNKLSEIQRNTMNDIISKYDSSNLSEEDEQSMKLEFKEAGILPGRELGSALEAADIFPGRELGAALNKVGLGISIKPQSQIPSGIIVDNRI